MIRVVENATPYQVLDAWATNLESGEFAQGRKRLCRDGMYCCLGVLCETLGLMSHDETYSDGVVKVYGREDGISVLPPAAWERVFGPLPFSDVEPWFIMANDDYGLSFDDIAYNIRNVLMPALEKA